MSIGDLVNILLETIGILVFLGWAIREVKKAMLKIIAEGADFVLKMKKTVKGTNNKSIP